MLHIRFVPVPHRLEPLVTEQDRLVKIVRRGRVVALSPESEAVSLWSILHKHDGRERIASLLVETSICLRVNPLGGAQGAESQVRDGIAG